MAPRANWKGYLRLSLVTCPIALYPATTEAEKISFHQINRKTGNRIRYLKVDAETGEEVDRNDIIKGYETDSDSYIQLSQAELDSVALESTRTIDIAEFVPRSEIDDLYIVRPYYIAPEGKIGRDAFAVIRETIRDTGKVALGRVVLTSREHVIALEPRDNGLVGLLLRFPYELRDAADYFDDIGDVKITKEMLDLAGHIVREKSGHFKPDAFEDRYEMALADLIRKKQSGQRIARPKAERKSNVISLMDALKKSVAGHGEPAPRRKRASPRRAAARTRSAAKRRKAG